jgi:hypothetical protein
MRKPNLLTNPGQSFYTKQTLLEKPGVLTTSGRSKLNYHRWFINKHIIPAGDGQFTPAQGGQGHWYFQITTILHVFSA